MPLRAWIGHYQGNPYEWFLIFGENKREAMLFIDCEWAPPDPRSMKEVTHAMALNFKARIVEDDFLKYVECQAHPGEITLGEGAGHEELRLWIQKLIENPLGPPDEPELSPLGMMMGVPSAELMRAYLEDVDVPVALPEKKVRKSAPPAKKTKIVRLGGKSATRSDLPPVAAPARRALADAGINSLRDLAKRRETDVKALHGVGPSTVKTLRAALAEKRLSFAPG